MKIKVVCQNSTRRFKVREQMKQFCMHGTLKRDEMEAKTKKDKITYNTRQRTNKTLKHEKYDVEKLNATYTKTAHLLLRPQN